MARTLNSSVNLVDETKLKELMLSPGEEYVRTSLVWWRGRNPKAWRDRKAGVNFSSVSCSPLRRRPPSLGDWANWETHSEGSTKMTVLCNMAMTVGRCCPWAGFFVSLGVTGSQRSRGQELNHLRQGGHTRHNRQQGWRGRMFHPGRNFDES